MQRRAQTEKKRKNQMSHVKCADEGSRYRNEKNSVEDKSQMSNETRQHCRLSTCFSESETNPNDNLTSDDETSWLV